MVSNRIAIQRARESHPLSFMNHKYEKDIKYPNLKNSKVSMPQRILTDIQKYS